MANGIFHFALCTVLCYLYSVICYLFSVLFFPACTLYNITSLEACFKACLVGFI